MKCCNCGGKVEQFINSVGGGSRYCLDGCGFYEEFPTGTEFPPKRDMPEAPAPRPKRKRKSDT